MTFKCPIVKIDKLEKHPNADTLDVATIGGYQCIVKSGTCWKGQYVVYIPADALLPTWLLRHLGFWDEAKGKGTLHGPLGNRVKPIRLRGVLSEGVILKVLARLNEGGKDMAAALGITKYEVPVPVTMAGQTYRVPEWASKLECNIPKWDLENIKGQMWLFNEGEPVFVSEKLHGTQCVIGRVAGNWFVTSKGLHKKGLFIKDGQEGNLYVGALNEVRAKLSEGEDDFVLYGEIVGPGVQDLTYGFDKPTFILFAMWTPERGLYPVNWSGTDILFAPSTHGDVPFNYESLMRNIYGPSAFGGLKEGWVIWSADRKRVAKMINPDYLTRKGGTEWN